MVAALAGCAWRPAIPDIGVSRETTRMRALYDVDWWTQLVPDQFLEYGPQETGTPAIDADTGRLIVGTRDGLIRAVGEQGRVAWTFTAQGRFEAGPTIHEGVVYAACADGHLYALDAKTGLKKWVYDSKEELATQPVVVNGKVLVAAQSDVIYAINAATGEWLWQYRRDTPSGFTIRGISRPSVQGELAFMGFSDGYLVALRIDDGTVKWSKALSKPGAYGDVDTGPWLDEKGLVYAASYKDGLFALDAQTGEVRWHTDHRGLVSLYGTGELLFGAGDQELTAFDRSTGRSVWTMTAKDTALRLPVLARGQLLVPANDALLFVDPATGRTETRWDPGQGVTATPLVRGAQTWVLSNRGFLYALTLGRTSGG
jgi:outer membrane protein assembly factor BamB